MNSSTRLALILGLQLSAGAAFLACGGDDEPAKGNGTDSETDNENDSAGDGDQASSTLQLSFAPMYSAFVPNHESTIPVTLSDKSLTGAKFTSSDSTIADVVANAEGNGATVTIKKAGDVIIKAVAGTEKGEAKLKITGYTEADWETGKARYSNGMNAINSDGGAPNPLTLIAPGGKNDNGACTTCHGDQASLFKIQHTPMQTGGYSDEELVTIFTMGMKPAKAVQQSMIPTFLWGRFHAWAADDAQKKGLIAYLRTLPPKPNGVIDYGVRMVDGGFVDNMGNPIVIPGLPGAGGRDGGLTGVRPADGGATTTPTTPADAGTSATLDAGT